MQIKSYILWQLWSQSTKHSTEIYIHPERLDIHSSGDKRLTQIFYINVKVDILIESQYLCCFYLDRNVLKIKITFVDLFSFLFTWSKLCKVWYRRGGIGRDLFIGWTQSKGWSHYPFHSIDFHSYARECVTPQAQAHANISAFCCVPKFIFGEICEFASRTPKTWDQQKIDTSWCDLLAEFKEPYFCSKVSFIFFYILSVLLFVIIMLNSCL